MRLIDFLVMAAIAGMLLLWLINTDPMAKIMYDLHGVTDQ